MHISIEEEYGIQGLKIGDEVELSDHKNNPYLLTTNGLVNSKGDSYSADKLYQYKWKKINFKIWDLATIKRGDSFYVLSQDMQIKEYNYNPDISEHTAIINNGISFTKKEYAWDYLVLLTEFNNNYKEKETN